MSDILREDWRVLIADVDGTGLRAGHIGIVIATQNRGAAGSRWTQLAPDALQLRFFRGAEIWVEPHEVRPASEIEITGEKRRRLRTSSSG